MIMIGPLNIKPIQSKSVIVTVEGTHATSIIITFY